MPNSLVVLVGIRNELRPGFEFQRLAERAPYLGTILLLASIAAGALAILGYVIPALGFTLSVGRHKPLRVGLVLLFFPCGVALSAGVVLLIMGIGGYLALAVRSMSM